MAGLIAHPLLAHSRNDPVYLRTSRYVPPRWEAVRDAMPALFDLLENEPEPGVRAVLSHWLFGYVHPYPNGNGPMARFLMNAMFASGGYPWTVIRINRLSHGARPRQHQHGHRAVWGIHGGTRQVVHGEGCGLKSGKQDLQ